MDLRTIPTMKKVESSGDGKITRYVREGDDLQVEGMKAYFITYVALDDKLFDVAAIFNNTDFDRIKSLYDSRYGKPMRALKDDYYSFRGVSAFMWLFGDVKIFLRNVFSE